MSATLFRSSTAARAALRAGAARKVAGIASTSFVRGKATLPDLPCECGSGYDDAHIDADSSCTDDYGALEPAISGKIMELHHKMHHNTYVNSFNAATEQLQAAESKGDIQAQIALQPVINFHGGGHVNHSLFWENLAPKSQGGGGEPEGKVKVSTQAL